MALNLIRNRLARVLTLNRKDSVYHQKRRPDKMRRQSYKNGSHVLTIRHSFTMSEALAARLIALCQKYKVQRGVVIRDALDFYLGIAEQEYDDLGALTGLDAIPPKLAPGYVKRPDGVIVNTMDINPTAKKK